MDNSSREMQLDEFFRNRVVVHGGVVSNPRAPDRRLATSGRRLLGKDGMGCQVWKS